MRHSKAQFGCWGTELTRRHPVLARSIAPVIPATMTVAAGRRPCTAAPTTHGRLGVLDVLDVLDARLFMRPVGLRTQRNAEHKEGVRLCCRT